MLAGNWRDKSLSCLSKTKAAVRKSPLIYCTSSVCVMFYSERNNSPLFGRQEKEEWWERRLWDKPCQHRRVSVAGVRVEPALDPHIKGLRESFPPFKAWAYVPAPEALILATSLPPMSRNYTLLQYLSPLVSPFFRTVDNPTLPVIPVSSLLALFIVSSEPAVRFCQVTLVSSWSSPS